MAAFSNLETLSSKARYTYTTSEGQSIQDGNTVVTPISRALTVQLPFWGFVWNRPVAVRVEDGESATELAIVDLTLSVTLGLLSLGLAASLVAFLAGRARSKP